MLACLNSSVRQRTIVLCALFLGLSLGTLSGQTSYDDIWSNAVLYQDSDNPTVQKIAFTGRFQGEMYWFDADEGDADDSLWRRLRMGFKNTVFENWTFHFEGDFKLDRSQFYNRLTDAYISRKFSDDVTFKFGKQSAGFTLDGATSSKSLITLQRNNLTNNLWFTAEYFTGASIAGDLNDGFFYKAGLYSNDGNGEFSHFDAGYFGLLSVGKDFSDQSDFDKAEVRVDVVLNDNHKDANTRDFEQVTSLVAQLEQGNWGLSSGFSWGNGSMGQSDVWGFVLMPYYNFSDLLQGVFRYTVINSSGENGVRLGRYESRVVSGRGDSYGELYAGFNVFLYGHKLKWQTGLKMTEMDDKADDGGELNDSLGVTTGFRISW